MSTGFWQVFFSDKFEKLRVSGDDIVLYRFAHISCHSVCFDTRNFRRDPFDRLVTSALVGGRYNMRFQLGDDLFGAASMLHGLLASSALRTLDCLLVDRP